MNVLLILVNSALFDYYVAYSIHVAVLVFAVLISAVTLVVLAYATFTEAGIIPRQPKPPVDGCGKPLGDAPTGKKAAALLGLNACTQVCN